jgi:hypothetical protein
MTIRDIAFVSLPVALLGTIFAWGFVMLIWAAIKGEFEKRQQLRDQAKVNHQKALGGLWVHLPNRCDVSSERAGQNVEFLFSSIQGISKGFVVSERAGKQDRMFLETKRAGRKNNVI